MACCQVGAKLLSSNKGGWQPNQGGTGVKDATKPVSVPALGPRQWSVGLAFAG